MRTMLKIGGVALLIALFNPIGSISSAQASNWWESIKLKGDFRYRHEMIDKEDKDTRSRHRIRARLAVVGKVNDDMKVALQLATGSDDPVSTNQTLDDAFTTKNIGLDLAYFQYQPSILSGLRVTGGKLKNPFFRPGKSELIWDSDWNPEGGAVTLNHSVSDFNITLIGAGFWIDENSQSNDVSLIAGQCKVKLDFNEKNSSVTVGGSYFGYNNILGHKALYEVDDAKGNSADVIYDTTFYATISDDTAVGEIAQYHTYQNDYKLLEIFLELNHELGRTPTTVMFDFVTNSSADSLNNGWLIGLRVGKAKTSGSWEFRYNYRKVEKDAVLGVFTNSDFGGGGTDAEGHAFGSTFMPAKNTAFGVTYFANTVGLNADEDSFGRLQVDLQLKF